MMKRVVCDETFPPLALQLFLDNKLHKLIEQQPKHFALRQDILREDVETEEQKCFTTTMVRFLLPPLSFQHTHTPQLFMMKDYLDVNFYSIFSEAQNHADKFLVAFLLIELYPHFAFEYLNFERDSH
jgi:hypothetical protein